MSDISKLTPSEFKDKYIQYCLYFPEENFEWRPIKLLLIGPSETGKTTFIKNILFSAFGTTESQKIFEYRATTIKEEESDFVDRYRYRYITMDSENNRLINTGIELLDVAGESPSQWGAALMNHIHALDGILIFVDIAKGPLPLSEDRQSILNIIDERVHRNFEIKNTLAIIFGAIRGTLKANNKISLKSIMFIGNKLDLIRDLDSEIFTSESIPILKKEEILTKFYSSKYSSLIGNISEQCEKIKIPLIEAYGSSLEFGILKKKFFKFTKLIHNGFEIRDGSLKTFHEWYYGGK